MINVSNEWRREAKQSMLDYLIGLSIEEAEEVIHENGYDVYIPFPAEIPNAASMRNLVLIDTDDLEIVVRAEAGDPQEVIDDTVS